MMLSNVTASSEQFFLLLKNVLLQERPIRKKTFCFSLQIRWMFILFYFFALSPNRGRCVFPPEVGSFLSVAPDFSGPVVLLTLRGSLCTAELS